MNNRHIKYVVDVKSFVYSIKLVLGLKINENGPYSTNAINYAKMISAAISKVSGTEDECYFGPIIKP